MPMSVAGSALRSSLSLAGCKYPQHFTVSLAKNIYTIDASPLRPEFLYVLSMNPAIESNHAPSISDIPESNFF
jgi:hypothetical protein